PSRARADLLFALPGKAGEGNYRNLPVTGALPCALQAGLAAPHGPRGPAWRNHTKIAPAPLPTLAMESNHPPRSLHQRPVAKSFAGSSNPDGRAPARSAARGTCSNRG